jgi:hypothetical protein
MNEDTIRTLRIYFLLLRPFSTLARSYTSRMPPPCCNHSLKKPCTDDVNACFCSALSLAFLYASFTMEMPAILAFHASTYALGSGNGQGQKSTKSCVKSPVKVSFEVPLVRGAADPPHRGPGPPLNGITNGIIFSGGSRVTDIE